MKILLIEDDRKYLLLLTKMLENNGYQVTYCVSAKEALERELELHHDLIILDLLLGEERGEDFIQNLKKRKLNIPILVISCLSEVSSKIDLLKLGADDYLTKPFDSDELLARVEAISRRYSDTLILKKDETYGNITFQWKQHKVIFGTNEIFLTRQECKFLQLLIQNKGEIIRFEDILEKVWGVGLGYHSNIVQSTVKRIRQKIGNDYSNKLIRNVHGIGYCITLPDLNEK